MASLVEINADLRLQVIRELIRELIPVSGLPASGNGPSTYMPHLQPLKSQSSHRRFATLLKRRSMMLHQYAPPTARQRQIGMHHLMHNSPPNILFDARFKHRGTQLNLDLRYSADSVRQADTTQCAARRGRHIDPIHDNPVIETATEEHRIHVLDHKPEELRADVLLRRRESHAKPEQRRGLLAVHGLTEACKKLGMSLSR